MNINYFNLPFGAQLLLWTSRVLIKGCCRAIPNKYQLINMAYNKVGIYDGADLHKKFLFMLKDRESIILQHINCLDLNKTEINLINCIEDYKSKKFYDDHYLEIWNLKDNQRKFILAAQYLASAYKAFNLDTDLNSIYLNRNAENKEKFMSKTLH